MRRRLCVWSVSAGDDDDDDDDDNDNDPDQGGRLLSLSRVRAASVWSAVRSRALAQARVLSLLQVSLILVSSYTSREAVCCPFLFTTLVICFP